LASWRQNGRLVKVKVFKTDYELKFIELKSIDYRFESIDQGDLKSIDPAHLMFPIQTETLNVFPIFCRIMIYSS